MDDEAWTERPERLREYAESLEKLARKLPLPGPTLQRLLDLAEGARRSAEAMEKGEAS